MLHMPQEQTGKRAPGDLVNQVISLYQKGDLQATLSQAQKLIQYMILFIIYQKTLRKLI